MVSTGTTIAEADALPDAEEACDAASIDTVGMAVAVADAPQAESVSAKTLVNIQNTFFIYLSPCGVSCEAVIYL
jgi:hypothetical protein